MVRIYVDGLTVSGDQLLDTRHWNKGCQSVVSSGDPTELTEGHLYFSGRKNSRRARQILPAWLPEKVVRTRKHEHDKDKKEKSMITWQLSWQKESFSLTAIFPSACGIKTRA
jgi:hypothetical protein